MLEVKFDRFLQKIHDSSTMGPFRDSLVDIAWTFHMLHGNLQAKFLQNMENSRSLNGNIL